ncbi:amidohydrolase family protein [Mesorhizobium sp. Cs1299R1N1]|uniref:amidohydrolase family protein n=1 Tax=Mesorhizobium sp. Cs1299R1N1 TaxID=3015172 RepID=UPI00301D4744
MQKEPVDILILNGDVFTGNRASPHHRPGALAIKDGKIVVVGLEADIASAYSAPTTINAGGALVHPGFIETHLHMTGMPYHGAPFSPAGGVVSKVNYASLKVATTPEVTAAYSSAAACSLLQRGFTLHFEPGTVFETDAFADAMTRCGIRAMVSAPFGWDDLSSFRDIFPQLHNDALAVRAPPDAQRVIDQCSYELRRNKDENALVRGYVCLYGEGTATDELTRQAAKLAADSDVILWQHQSFLSEFVDDEKRKRGDSGAVRMHRLGALKPSTMLAHMNVLDAADVELIISEKPGLSWCPNNALGYRVTPPHKCWFPYLYKRGVSVSLGVDTNVIHPLGIAGLLSLYLSASIGERLHDSDPFYMQTIDAARNVGMGDRIGSLEVGKRADVVIREARDITHYSWRDDMGGLLALSSSMIPVDTVVVDGKVVMKSGRLATLDQDGILAEALRQRDALAAKLEG